MAPLHIRALYLRRYLERVFPSRAASSAEPAQPIHLVAHSMGGLDARYFLSHLNDEKAYEERSGGKGPKGCTLTLTPCQ